ncbi:hypothetical protein QE422_002202 [Chryseobacterium sp. SORGH_AS 447]|uniref:hypothetical protein n=1 Tax=Chryseobacterium sp. SORGH_AS_0447 TaxID=3041769 RepID=UPI00278AC9C4|nr:hypothetical protein [Chryseobacterium sp. SORGH_AS_0447]MDQ1161834.1 hypothetical protein [Chryseobacterium sp. SORGH_AS_0447]
MSITCIFFHDTTTAGRRDGDPENNFFNIGKFVCFTQQVIANQGTVFYDKRVNRYSAQQDKRENQPAIYRKAFGWRLYYVDAVTRV